MVCSTSVRIEFRLPINLLGRFSLSSPEADAVLTERLFLDTICLCRISPYINRYSWICTIAQPSNVGIPAIDGSNIGKCMRSAHKRLSHLFPHLCKLRNAFKFKYLNARYVWMEYTVFLQQVINFIKYQFFNVF